MCPPHTGRSCAPVGSVSAVFLGDKLIVWLMLALGGALFAGNVLALIRPPAKRDETDLAEAPRSRSIFMAAIGLIVAIAAVGGLLKG
jgi:hypothetical protein